MQKKLSKSQNLITLALYKKMLRKDINQITVSEICTYAGVARMSFYRSYNSIDDIFVQYCDACFEEFYEEYQKIENPTGYEFVTLVFTKMKQYSRQIKVLHKANKDFILFKRFETYTTYVVKKLKLEENTFINFNPLTSHFLAGGFYGVMLHWIENDFKKSPNEMAQDLISIVSN